MTSVDVQWFGNFFWVWQQKNKTIHSIDSVFLKEKETTFISLNKDSTISGDFKYFSNPLLIAFSMFITKMSVPWKTGGTLKDDPRIHVYNKIRHLYSLTTALGRLTWRLAARDIGNGSPHTLSFTEYTTVNCLLSNFFPKIKRLPIMLPGWCHWLLPSLGVVSCVKKEKEKKRNFPISSGRLGDSGGQSPEVCFDLIYIWTL